ncbi:MAG: M48 family metalloprotease [Acidiferrobacterales bacterium]
MRSVLRGRLVPLLVGFLLVAPIGNAGTQNLPDLGDESATLMSPYEERKLGEAVMRDIRRSLPLLEDPEINDYVQHLGQRLVPYSDAAGLDFHFFVIEDPTINAFAFVGGYVGMHTGLLLAAQSESEVAAVLAHETAHISQRHLQRMLVEGKRTSRQVLTALLAALVLAAAGQSEGAEAALALGAAGAAQKELNFTRANEEEADRVGIQILADAGFDPQAMPAFFERMQSWNRVNDTSVPEFLRTHPVTSRRIAESRTRADTYRYRQVPDTPEFQRIRAKLRARAPGNPKEIARGFKTNLTQGKYRTLEAERYGYALALLRIKEYKPARKVAADLRRDHPNIVSYAVLQAEIEMAAGQYEGALNYYASAVKKFPSNDVLTRYYAAALLKAARPQEAHKLLKEAVRDDADDPGLQKMLATAAGDSGELFEAHRAMANYYYLNGNHGAALQQLKIARRFVGESYYLQSSLEARIKEIEREIADASRKK